MSSWKRRSSLRNVAVMSTMPCSASSSSSAASSSISFRLSLCKRKKKSQSSVKTHPCEGGVLTFLIFFLSFSLDFKTQFSIWMGRRP